MPQRAVDYLELAGFAALRTFANEEAIEFLAEARDLDAGAEARHRTPRRARWLLALGEAHVNLSRYREGRETLEQGLRLLKARRRLGAWGARLVIGRPDCRGRAHTAQGCAPCVA